MKNWLRWGAVITAALALCVLVPLAQGGNRPTIKIDGKCISTFVGGTLHLKSPTGLPPRAVFRTKLQRIIGNELETVISRSFGLGIVDDLGQPSSWDLNCGGVIPLDPGKYRVSLEIRGHPDPAPAFFRVGDKK